MRELNTFGAVLTYAIEIETLLRDAYRETGMAAEAKAADRRRLRLERTRAEHVLEITLEPIHGLAVTDYAELHDASTDIRDKEAAATAFFQDASPKINVRQAQRVLQRCAREHAAQSNAG
ncbi:MAG: hypothetical protein OXG02_00705 [Chloroflexi bacterium]|nr:hypothetical protein [Anaerolineaceae bacterium]MCY4105217.1 hypothetical protein [Chloroflexota bacterium]